MRCLILSHDIRIDIKKNYKNKDIMNLLLLASGSACVERHDGAYRGALAKHLLRPNTHFDVGTRVGHS